MPCLMNELRMCTVHIYIMNACEEEDPFCTSDRSEMDVLIENK